MSRKLPLIVDGAWLEERLNDPNLRIVDATVRLKLPSGDGNYSLASGREGFEREHIPGAVFADLLADFADAKAPHPMTVPPSEQFADKIGALGIGNDNLVVVYDQLDLTLGQEFYQFWASRLWWHLRLEGFDNVAVLEGGLGRWKREGRKVTDAVTSYPKARFTAKRRPELLAKTDHVANAVNDPGSVLINVLDDETFSGERQTYARPGHIPSSEHLFFGKLVDSTTGGYEGADKVRALFEEVGALDTDKKPIVYCGGGIAATIAALQLARLGREDVAVYDGSMTEWASDPARPLEVGAK